MVDPLSGEFCRSSSLVNQQFRIKPQEFLSWIFKCNRIVQIWGEMEQLGTSSMVTQLTLSCFYSISKWSEVELQGWGLETEQILWEYLFATCSFSLASTFPKTIPFGWQFTASKAAFPPPDSSAFHLNISRFFLPLSWLSPRNFRASLKPLNQNFN